jgi:hypothetical protein
MEDRTYQEAVRQATSQAGRELKAQLLIASLAVQGGKTVEEATKDIADSAIRDIIKHTILAMCLQIVVGACRDSKTITQPQCEELLAYITKIGSNYIEFLANQD